MNELDYTAGGPDLLDAVGPLWEESGNERALPFYARFGFVPRNLVLARKPES